MGVYYKSFYYQGPRGAPANCVIHLGAMMPHLGGPGLQVSLSRLTRAAGVPVGMRDVGIMRTYRSFKCA